MKQKFIISAIIFILLFSSCFQRKHTFNDYFGTWTLETGNDDGIDNLLDLGLILTLRLEENNVLNIWYTIDTKKELINSGTWEIDEKRNIATFQLPDNEYGGYINGELYLSGSKLHYKTRSADWVFK